MYDASFQCAQRGGYETRIEGNLSGLSIQHVCDDRISIILVLAVMFSHLANQFDFVYY